MTFFKVIDDLPQHLSLVSRNVILMSVTLDQQGHVTHISEDTLLIGKPDIVDESLSHG